MSIYMFHVSKFLSFLIGSYKSLFKNSYIINPNNAFLLYLKWHINFCICLSCNKKNKTQTNNVTKEKRFLI